MKTELEVTSNPRELAGMSRSILTYRIILSMVFVLFLIKEFKSGKYFFQQLYDSQ